MSGNKPKTKLRLLARKACEIFPAVCATEMFSIEPIGGVNARGDGDLSYK